MTASADDASGFRGAIVEQAQGLASFTNVDLHADEQLATFSDRALEQHLRVLRRLPVGDVHQDRAVGRDGEAGSVDARTHVEWYAEGNRASGASAAGRNPERHLELRAPCCRQLAITGSGELGIDAHTRGELQKPQRAAAKTVLARIIPRPMQSAEVIAPDAASQVRGDHAEQSSSSASSGNWVWPWTRAFVEPVTTNTCSRFQCVSGAAMTTKCWPPAVTSCSNTDSARTDVT